MQAEYRSKTAGGGVDDKGILEALKQTYATKTKELEDKEVLPCMVTLAQPTSKILIHPCVGCLSFAWVLPIFSRTQQKWSYLAKIRYTWSL